MPRIFRHNRLDVVSLAALAMLACQWVEDAPVDGLAQVEDPRDVFSLGRVFERARLYARSEAAYRRVIDGVSGLLRGLALLCLADCRRRAGDHASAIALWEQASARGEAEAFWVLAIHHEHWWRDPAVALRVVESGRA